MTGLLDTGSQVTLIQQKVMEQHFSQVEKGTTPLVLTLKAANGLNIPYSGCAIMDSEVEGVRILEKGVVIVRDDCSTHPLLIGMNVIGTGMLFLNMGSQLSPHRNGSPDRHGERHLLCAGGLSQHHPEMGSWATFDPQASGQFRYHPKVK